MEFHFTTRQWLRRRSGSAGASNPCRKDSRKDSMELESLPSILESLSKPLESF